MHKKKIAYCVSFFLIACSTLFCTVGLQAQESRLDFERRTESEITGSFSDGRSKISFESRMLEEADRIRTTIRVNEKLVFDAEAQKNGRLLKGNGAVLSEKDKTGLIHFSQALEDKLGKEEKTLRSHELFLLGNVWYLAEAPVGMPIQTHQGVCPDPKRINPLTITTPCKELKPECSANGGDKDDDDGIMLLGGKCDYKPYEIWHDADSSHGFCTSNLCLGSFSNPSTKTDCTGRCGPGCPTVLKIGVYALDCAEHDVCCGLHGDCFAPIWVVCADEFRDAFLDTVCFENAVECK